MSNVAAEAETLKVAGLQGCIEIQAAEAAQVKVVDMKGITVADRNVQPGTTTISLPAGIYIVNDSKVAVR